MNHRLDSLFRQDLFLARQWWEDLRDGSGVRLFASADADEGGIDSAEQASVLTLERAGEHGGTFVIDETGVSLARDADECIHLLQSYVETSADDHSIDARIAEQCERRCKVRWLQSFARWPRAMGNGVGLPELLYLCLLYLRDAVGPRLSRAPVATAHSVANVLRDLVGHWNFVLPGSPSFEQRLMHMRKALADGKDVVLWISGDMDRFQPHMTSTARCVADMTVLAIGVDINEQFDNRVYDVHSGMGTNRDASVCEPSRDAQPGADVLPTASRAVCQEPVPVADLDRQMMCTIVSDAPVSPSDPMELLRVLARSEHIYSISVGLLTRHARVVPVRDCAKTVHQVEREWITRHVRELLARHIDESICLDASELVRWSLLSVGALDYMARFTGLPRHSITGATALRFDHWRCVSDLAVCHQLSHVERTRIWDQGAEDAIPAIRSASEDVNIRWALLRMIRDMWTLTVLNQECQAIFGLRWMEEYVILPQDTLRMARVCTQVLRNGTLRRPLVVSLLGYWMVFDRDDRFVCEDLTVALVLWCKIMHTRFGGRTETDVNIDSLLTAWHTPV